MSDKAIKYTAEEKKLITSIGKRIKTLREAKGWSQDELSVEALIPKNQVGRIERAEINTTIISLHKIATALKVGIEDLITTDCGD